MEKLTYCSQSLIKCTKNPRQKSELFFTPVIMSALQNNRKQKKCLSKIKIELSEVS